MPDPRFANVRWLFFDWGGVLQDEIDTFRNLSASVAKLATAAGIEISGHQFFEEMLAAEFAASNDKIGTALTQLGINERTQTNIFTGLESEDSPVSWYPGVIETLGALSSVYRLGLVSNNRPGIDQRLEAAGVKHFFDVRIGSGDVGVGKPDPAIFQLAVEQANCTAAEAVMIGDRVDNDIGGAKAVGMCTIRIRQGIYADQEPTSPDEHSDAEITDIRELPDLLL